MIYHWKSCIFKLTLYFEISKKVLKHPINIQPKKSYVNLAHIIQKTKIKINKFNTEKGTYNLIFNNHFY